ncbi:hypothetical protein ACHAWF_010145 [Thalassiosira exigua]
MSGERRFSAFDRGCCPHLITLSLFLRSVVANARLNWYACGTTYEHTRQVSKRQPVELRGRHASNALRRGELDSPTPRLRPPLCLSSSRAKLTMRANPYVVRRACAQVGHGGLYHSQSPEAYLAHTPGLVVVMPRGPRCAKGLLLSSIRSKDPVVFLEPKILYRSAVEEVPDADYEIPLGKAEILRPGTDVTVVGWGAQLRALRNACDLAAREGVSCELVDLRTILPWDADCIVKSVKKTGKLVVSHEAPITCGFGAEVAATVQRECFFHLEAPVERVCGYDTPFGLVFEDAYLPDERKNLDAIRRAMEFGA